MCKKIFSVLAVLLLVPMLAVSSGQQGGATGEMETVRALVMDSGEWGTPSADLLVYKTAAEASNITIEMEVMPGDAAHDIVSTRLAAGDLPDMMTIPRPYAQDYGPQGALEDLVSHLDKAPNLKEKFNMDANPWLYTAEGNLYFLPGGPAPYWAWGWVWRQDIADELDIAEPETIDDWVAAWRKVKAQKPDFIPWMAFWGVPMSHLAGAYGIGGDARGVYTFRNGEFSSPWISDEFKQIVTLCRDMYAEGIMWNEYLTADWDTFQAAEASGKVFSTTFYAGTMFNYVGEDIKSNITGVRAPKGPAGYHGHSWMGVGSYWGMAVPAMSKAKDGAVRFLDFINSDEGEILWLFGKEGETFYRKADGNYDYLDSIKAAAKDEGRSTDMYLRRTYNIGISGFNPMVLRPRLKLMNDMAMGDASMMGLYKSQAIVADDLAPYPPPVWNNKEESGRLTTLNADIDTYRQEMVAKFVAGQEPLTKWDEYVAQMKKLGTEEVEQIINQGYQRYLDLVGKSKGYAPDARKLLDLSGLSEAVK